MKQHSLSALRNQYYQYAKRMITIIRDRFLTKPLLIWCLSFSVFSQNVLHIKSIFSFDITSGFVSDVFPIYGMRRKPYLTIGALVYSSAFMLYALAAVDNVVRLDIISFCIAYFAMLQTAVRSPQPSRGTEEIARIIFCCCQWEWCR